MVEVIIMDKLELLNILKEFKVKNATKYGLVELGLFGSFARNESSTLSDVDIVLQTKTANLFNIVHIKADLEEKLQIPVDIVRLRDKMNPRLKKCIDRDAIYV